MRGWAVGLAALLWGSLASGQTPGSSPVEADPPAEDPAAAKAQGEDLPRERTDPDPRKALAAVLNPDKYGPAFLLGAQAEFLSPLLGASSLVFGYDFVPFQLEASFAVAVGPGTGLAGNEDDLYSAGLRLAVPVHRGLRADFSLVAGGGVAFIDPPDGETSRIGTLNVGGRFRVFASPSVATVATLGVALILREDDYRFALGARPLGAAGVVYFFR